MKYKTFFILILFTELTGTLLAKNTGTIQGRVVDTETRAPLPGTNVLIVNTQMGAATNASGEFTIRNVPVGSHIVKFNFIGYNTFQQTDVIVRPERITQLNAKLHMAILEGDAVTVSAGYFTESDEQPVSIINFSREEIRRAPGVAGDVSRIMLSLPSVAKVNDQSNQLIVRGGSPWENTFFVDNIEIPNINHFPDMATSSGPIGLINTDFIEDVNFHTGGFSSIYGDKLSSVMDIKFRDGNMEEFDGQLDLNYSGFGGVFEGPIPGEKGSWMVSARRSYLDLIVESFDVGTTIAPVYGDYQGKLVYNINTAHKLSLLALFSDDHNAPELKDAQENAMGHFGNQDLYNRTLGINWRALWGKSGYSNTSISFTDESFEEDWYETYTGKYDYRNHAAEQSLKFRNNSHFRFNNMIRADAGIDAKYLMVDYDNWFASTTNTFGVPIPEFNYIRKTNAQKAGTFINIEIHPVSPLSLNIGVRADHFTFNNNTHISPRFSFSYRLSALTSINGSTGLYYQNLPLYILSQRDDYKALDDPKSIHMVLGIEHLINETTKLTIEAYNKQYSHLPVDPSQPQINVIDQSYHANWGDLQENGVAKSYGLELILQKKLARDVYGLASVCWARSKYRDGSGIWRNRSYDNRYTFSFEGGYKPGPGWEVSLRWIYAGGVPYTPLDLTASALYHRDVFDDSKVNSVRYPDYHSMNVRMDKRFHFASSNLVAYLSIWNVYNHENIAAWYWNDLKQKQDKETQWLLMPIIGLEYEF